MNQESVLSRRHDHSNCDGMLLSSTEALRTMALVPIAAFVLILLAMMVPIQHSFGSNRTLDFSLFPDGSTHVCLLYTSPSPRDQRGSRMPSSA